MLAKPIRNCRTFNNCIYLPYWSHNLFQQQERICKLHVTDSCKWTAQTTHKLFLADHQCHRTTFLTTRYGYSNDISGGKMFQQTRMTDTVLCSFLVTFVMMLRFWIPPCHINLSIVTRSFSATIWPARPGLTTQITVWNGLSIVNCHHQVCHCTS